MITNREVRALYGAHAVISRKGRFTLVHLDRPSEAVVKQRTLEFDPNEFFERDCPLCEQQREGGVIVYDDDSAAESEEVLLE